MFKLNKKIFTLFGIGFLPISGTMGSLVAIFFYYIFYNYLNLLSFIFFLIFIFFYSFFFLNMSFNRSFLSSDPKEIVIDEFIGQSIPLILCENDFFLIILSFLLFRLFDITKPWPASYFDLKVKSTNAVLMDDIIAGLYTFFVIYLWV
jgi:phosphatidylglycerophosphatase A